MTEAFWADLLSKGLGKSAESPTKMGASIELQLTHWKATCGQSGIFLSQCFWQKFFNYYGKREL
jgi:hypothetical protein